MGEGGERLRQEGRHRELHREDGGGSKCAGQSYLPPLLHFFWLLSQPLSPDSGPTPFLGPSLQSTHSTQKAECVVTSPGSEERPQEPCGEGLEGPQPCFLS